MNVRLYKVTCYDAYLMDEEGEGFSLEPWGADTAYYKGCDDGGREYMLPEGCEIVWFEEEPRILWHGNQADIVSDQGRPLLVSIGSMAYLKEA